MPAKPTQIWQIVLIVGMTICITVPAASRGTMPAHSTDPENCEWHWQSAGGIGLWTERCHLESGVWQVEYREYLPGFVLTADGEDQETVIHLFTKPDTEGVDAILPTLREGGFIPDDEDCVFTPVSVRPAPRTLQFYQLMPTGTRLEALETTPADTIPEPPCGDYGWSTHGVRYFLSDIRQPGMIAYINVGQDGLFFDDTTVSMSTD